MAEKPLFVEEVAERLRKSAYTVRTYIKSGELKAYKHMGRGRLLIDPKELERFQQESQKIHVAYVAENVAYQTTTDPKRPTSANTKNQIQRFPQMGGRRA